jgi:hypothetical protein
MSEISLTAIFPLPPRFERVVQRKHGLSFPESPAIFDQGLPEYNHNHESCQHKRCKAHLNKRETVITIAEKTTSQRGQQKASPSKRNFVIFITSPDSPLVFKLLGRERVNECTPKSIRV